MKIIVVEDIEKYNKLILKNVEQVLIEKNLDINIMSFYKYNNDLKKIIYNGEIKIYILDIELGENSSKSGYDISREIRLLAHDWYSIIIICSIYKLKQNFIASRLSIFKYISKNNNFEKNLKLNLKKALNELNKENAIDINNHCKLYYSEILYALKEKYSKYCIIKTLDNEFRVRKNIYQLEEELHLKKFKRHLLANEENITSVSEEEITFKNNEKIKL